MRYSKLSLARHEQVERPRPFAPRLWLLRSSESSGDSQQTHHHRASPGRVLGFSSPPVSALWCWHSTSSVRHRSGSPARKPASAAFPPVAWRAFSRSSNTDIRGKAMMPGDLFRRTCRLETYGRHHCDAESRRVNRISLTCVLPLMESTALMYYVFHIVRSRIKLVVIHRWLRWVERSLARPLKICCTDVHALRQDLQSTRSARSAMRAHA
jgi:hypothetical protein